MGIYFSKNSLESNKLNWEDKVEKLKRILDNWRKRNLTFFGKVTVLKSLALSQIMYVAAVLYTPEWAIKQIRKLSLDFIWNNKKYKIKDSYLQRHYVNGGIKLMDIKTQIMSLKLRWIGRILDETDGNWKHIPKLQFNKIGGIHLCLNYNLKLDQLKYINKMSPFYEEIFKAWCMLNNKKEQTCTSQDDILNQVIWYNSYITHAKKPLFLKEWIKAGIVTVRDILVKSSFITFLEIQRKLDSAGSRATCFFDLEKIKMCIKKEWRNMLLNVNLEHYDKIKRNVKVSPSLRVGDKMYQIWELKTKTFYKILTENNILESRVEGYWQNKVHNNPIGQSELEWKNVWKFKLKSVRDTRLKNFNLKFLYNIVPVNSNLYKWNLTESDKCPECNIKEDILHAFLFCEKLNTFWGWLENIIHHLQMDYGNFKMSCSIIIYGFNIENKKYNLLNFIVNCALFVIYKCIVIRNFEDKKYGYVKLQNMLQQEIKNQIYCDANSKNIRKFFSEGEIDIVKYHLT